VLLHHILTTADAYSAGEKECEVTECVCGHVVDSMTNVRVQDPSGISHGMW